jgi:hypothetical protein
MSNDNKKSPFNEVIEYFSKEPILEKYNYNFEECTQSVFKNISNESGILGISSSLETVLKDLLFIHSLTRSKLKYLYSASDSLYEDSNPIVLSYCTRAIIEHVATYAMFIKEVENLVDKLSGQNSPDKAKADLTKFHNFVKQFYYGSSAEGKSKSKSKPIPIHVESSIRTLDEYVELFADTNSIEGEVNQQSYSFLFHEEASEEEFIKRYKLKLDPYSKKNIVKVDYDFLCDFVHPNYGSNILVSGGELSKGSVGLIDDGAKNLLILFIKKCLLYWFYFREFEPILIVESTQISAWFERSMKNGAKASRIFAVKKSKSIGDGKTADSALLFPSARDVVEEWQMYEEYLSEQKLSEVDHVVLGFVDGYAVKEIRLSNEQLLYVKFKNRF